jgi:HEAT repeat protein
VFDKIKGWLQGDHDGAVEGGGTALEARAEGRRRTAPSGRLVDGLKILDAGTEGLAARAIAYVHTGDGPELVTELSQRADDAADRLLNRPATLGAWTYTTQAEDKAIKERVPGWDVDKGATARGNLYTLTEPVGIDVLVRLGRLFAAASSGVSRASDQLPAWFAALLTDVAKTSGSRRTAGRNGKPGVRDQWTPQLLAAILRDGGVAEGSIPATVVAGIFDRPSTTNYYGDPLAVLAAQPGVEEYLVAHVQETSDVAVALRATGKVELLQFLRTRPAALDAFVGLVAQLATDSAKSVREEAAGNLAALPATRQVELLEPLLTTMPASRLGGLVTHLVGVEGGVDALRRAHAADDRGARGTLLSNAIERATALDVATVVVDEPLDLPPFTPLPEVALGDAFVRSARDAVDRRLAAARDELAALQALPKAEAQSWRLSHAQGAVKDLAAITDDHLTQVAQYLSGALTKVPPRTVLVELQAPAIRGRLDGLTLLHDIRFARSHGGGRQRYPWYQLNATTDMAVDLRILADGVERAGVQDSEAAVAELVFDTWFTRGTFAPEHLWPYFAEHPRSIDTILGLQPSSTVATYSRSERLEVALTILGGFPTIPNRYLPRLAELALGEGKTHRVAAQKVLESHVGARELAEQGLRDGKAEIRVTAAVWLQRLGDPAALPALRAALAKERREVARAAFLGALESLGDDISADLAPATLLAEATKGLKAKAPASMAWFPLDGLPGLRWAADGEAVPVEVVRWWVVLAVKLKDPSGLGLIARYESLLDDESRAALGRFALDAWIGKDTQGPTAEESRAYADSEAQPRYDRYQHWYKQHPQYYEAEASRTVDQHHQDAFREHQANYLGSAIADKGLLALTVGMPGADLTRAVQQYLKAHNTRRAQIEALVRALAANGDPASIQLLLSVARRHRQATVQAVAQQLAEDLAERRGWSAEELADRTVQTAGFEDDGILHLDLGSREYTGRITPTFTLELTNEAGKVVKALPAPRADDDPDQVRAAKSQLSTSRKELKAVVALQTQRLYEAMCTGREWPVADWLEFVAGHPVMSRLAAGLVWLENPGPDQRAFRPGDAGALIDVDDEDVSLAQGATVSVAHGVLLGADQAGRWREHLADYEIRPLFDQLEVTVPVTDRSATAISDRKGWLTDSFTVRGRATKLGYARSQAEDGGWFSGYEKAYPSVGITAVIEFTGAFLPEENIPAAITELVFRRSTRAYGQSAEARLADLPPVLVAESYRDYLTVAAGGSFDAAWEKKSAW